MNNDDLGSPSAVKPSFENRWNVMKCENFFYEVIGLLPVFDAVIIENCLARRGIQSNNPFLFHTPTHISAPILTKFYQFCRPVQVSVPRYSGVPNKRTGTAINFRIAV